MAGKTVLIIANLDTRGAEFRMVKDLIEAKGHHALLLDFSMEQEPFFAGDITCEEVAQAGGLDIEKVRTLYRSERRKATENQIRGATRIVQRLVEEQKIQGVLGIGGGTTSLVATGVMRTLPFGMPKLMASSVASHPLYVDECVGTKDIAMFNTVVDVVGLNPILEIQLVNAIGAICGMVETMTTREKAGLDFTVKGGKRERRAVPPIVENNAVKPGAKSRRGGIWKTQFSPGWNLKFDQPAVAISGFGFAERSVEPAVRYLRDKGYIAVPCHAQGRGDRAMDELIREGWFDGVIDLVSRGIVEQMLGGNCAAGEDRLLAAAETGLPQIVAPSGLDMLSVGGRPELLERYKKRPMAIIDHLRVEVRTSAEEMEQAARIVADRLNRAKAPCAVLIPLRGWSALDRKGAVLFDPVADQKFVDTLKKHLKADVPVVEVDIHLNTPEFAREAVNLFHHIYSKKRTSA